MKFFKPNHLLIFFLGLSHLVIYYLLISWQAFFLYPVIFLLFFLSYKIFLTRQLSPGLIKLVVLFGVLFCLLLAFSLPQMSSDLAYYFTYAKIFSYYHQNPYLVSPASVFLGEASNFFSDYYWLDVPYLSGPLLLLITAVINFWLGQSFYLNVVALKLLYSLAFFLAGGLLLNLISWRKNPMAGLISILYFWNPFLIINTAGQGHPESLLVFLLLLALWFFVKKRYTLVGLCLNFAVAIKIFPLILLPLFGRALKEKSGSYRPHLKSIFFGSLLPFVLIWSLAAFYNFLPQSTTLAKLAQEPNDGLFISFFHPFFGLSSPVLVWLKWLGFLIFCAIYGFLFFHRFYSQGALPVLAKKFGLALLVFLIFVMYFIQSWYFVCLVPLFLVVGRRREIDWAFYLSFFNGLAYFILAKYYYAMILLLFLVPWFFILINIFDKGYEMAYSFTRLQRSIGFRKKR